MKRFATATALLALLAACDNDQPLSFDPTVEEPETPEGGETVNGVPARVAGELRVADYDPDAGTLSVRLLSLDGDELLQEYTAAGTLDGYDVYVQQDDPLDRSFTAFAAESESGGVEAIVVMDGGQFNRYFGGVTYSRSGQYDAPTEGLASYAGNYVGLLNGGTTAELPAPPVDPAILPVASSRVTGQVFINADFTDGTLNGAIYNRSATISGTATDLENLNLIVTEIDSSGRFEGEVELGVQETVGNYAGILGGNNANGLAGGLFMEGDFISTVEGENEYGIFVTNQCGTAGSDPVCTTGLVEDVDNIDGLD
ncbi:thymidylate synthase [Yoonia sp. SS1-5]|uniref:Thymidylate synthase n=1 Tax=Yoonia rhodophyticola TaxID=3137370 RepID=A0AAN0NK62_9RHOB